TPRGWRSAPAPPQGPHPRPGFLRSALRPREGGAHLGAGERHAQPGGPTPALSITAAVPRDVAGCALPAGTAPRGSGTGLHWGLLGYGRAGVPPWAHGRLPDRDWDRLASGSARPRARARGSAIPPRAGMDLGSRPGPRRRSATP